jgi:hypothetical protein
MRALNLVFVSSIGVLIAGAGCDSENGDSNGPNGGTAGTAGTGGTAGTAGTGGSGGDEPDAEAPPPEPDASSDAGAPPTACELIEQAFETFLAASRSCSDDSDCRIIGDCGPNVDWRAINESAAAQGYNLMEARCGVRGFDGPEHAARCQSGVCVVGEENGYCGGDYDGGNGGGGQEDESDAGDPGDAAVGDSG